MALIPGTRIGSYEITAQLGVGGMGEVYRATDTNLKRQVAIKVLPDAVASDAERLARFQREAEVLAALNHPNIAAIHGLEKSDGRTALVMELVEGPTLADRVVQGPLPIDEALAVATQIAEALEAAHERGIIHRDLKPANIKLRSDGTVKVLDFGLAKAMEPAAAPGASTGQAQSMSPTITTPAMTQAGVILGTAAYMSPEQAKGQLLDRRTDIWAFGCVLYEMLTGRRAFAAEDVPETFVAVLRGEVDWDALAGVPPQVQVAVRRCLQKDRRQRFGDVQDVRLALEGAFESGIEVTSPEGTRPRQGVLAALPWLLGGMAVASVAAWFLASGPVASPAPSRLLMTLPPEQELVRGYLGPQIAVSPDGRLLAYSARVGGVRRIYLRPLDSLEARPVPGTENADTPFFSPDGMSLGFVTNASVIGKVPVGGGEARVVCECFGNARGISWGPDNTIVYSPNVNISGIWSVPADGGEPRALTTLGPDEVAHRWPQLLDGQVLLFTAGLENVWELSSVVAERLGTGERVTLVEGATYGRYLPTGHLVYLRNETLYARPFDTERLEFTGPESRVVEGVSQHPSSGAPSAAFSASGTLVYVQREEGQRLNANVPVWIGMDGGVEPVGAEARPYASFDLSRDGRRIALADPGPNGGVWVYEIDAGRLTPFAQASERGQFPVWSFDGTGISFSARHDLTWGLSWKAADFSEGLRDLGAGSNSPVASSASPDGLLAYTIFEQGSTEDADIWLAHITGDSPPERWLDTPSFAGGGMFSPDGSWMAYTSDESGRYEVYVRPFPGPGIARLISAGGGQMPVWRPDGQGLWYVTGSTEEDVQIMSVGTTIDPTFDITRAAVPVVRFPAVEGVAPPILSSYDVSPDGRRFMAIRQGVPSAAPGWTRIVVVQNWFEELRERVPVN